jgi:pimeloyl-ACP methyl ester carboxylesterase
MTDRTPELQNQAKRGCLPALIGSTFALGGLAGSAWLAYSTFFIDHNRALTPALEAERRTFACDGAGILSYYVDKRGEGRPLLLVHSINAAASAYEMQPIFQHFRGSRPVYAIDLPGFGFSDRAARVYSPDLYARALQAMLASQIKGDQSVDVVALSLGCEFAAMAALEMPARVHSLTLISPTGFTVRQNAASSQQAAQSGFSDTLYKAFSFPLWGQAFYDLLVTRPSIRWFLSLNFTHAPPANLIDYAVQTSHRPGARHAPFYFVSGKLFSPNIREAVYQKLTMPVQVIYDQDPNVRFDALPEMAERPNWQLCQIAPTRGLPHWERMDEVGEALTAFFAVKSAL